MRASGSGVTPSPVWLTLLAPFGHTGLGWDGGLGLKNPVGTGSGVVVGGGGGAQVVGSERNADVATSLLSTLDHFGELRDGGGYVPITLTLTLRKRTLTVQPNQGQSAAMPVRPFLCRAVQKGLSTTLDVGGAPLGPRGLGGGGRRPGMYSKGGGGGLAGTTSSQGPPMVPTKGDHGGPLRLFLNPLGAEAKNWLSASNIGRGRGGGPLLLRGTAVLIHRWRRPTARRDTDLPFRLGRALQRRIVVPHVRHVHGDGHPALAQKALRQRACGPERRGGRAGPEATNALPRGLRWGRPANTGAVATQQRALGRGDRKAYYIGAVWDLQDGGRPVKAGGTLWITSGVQCPVVDMAVLQHLPTACVTAIKTVYVCLSTQQFPHLLWCVMLCCVVLCCVVLCCVVLCCVVLCCVVLCCVVLCCVVLCCVVLCGVVWCGVLWCVVLCCVVLCCVVLCCVVLCCVVLCCVVLCCVVLCCVVWCGVVWCGVLCCVVLCCVVLCCVVLCCVVLCGVVWCCVVLCCVVLCCVVLCCVVLCCVVLCCVVLCCVVLCCVVLCCVVLCCVVLCYVVLCCVELC